MKTLSVDALSVKSSTKTILSNISMRCESGVPFLITGKNGAGKSTLLRCLSGLLSVSSGDILYNNLSIHEDLVAYQREVFYLGHQIALKPSLTLAENLAFDTRYPTPHESDMVDALTTVNLDIPLDVHALDLSRGQLQKLALSKCFLSNASIWILDEPFTGLDANSVALMEHRLIEVAGMDKIILLSSHRVLPTLMASSKVYEL